MAATLLSDLGIVCVSCDCYNDALATTCVECSKPLGSAPPLAAVPSVPKPGPVVQVPVAVKPSAAAATARPFAPPSSQPIGAPPVAAKPTAPPPGAKPGARPGTSPGAPIVPAVTRPTAPAIPVVAGPPAAASAAAKTATPFSAPVAPPPPGPTGVPPPKPLGGPAVTAPARTAGASQHKVVVVRGSAPNSVFKLPAGSVGAGKSKGLVLFPEDQFLAPLHATFFYKDGKLFVRDEGGASGTFVRITKAEPVNPGSLFSAGDRLLRYQGPSPVPPAAQPIPYGAPSPNATLFIIEELLEGGRPGRTCARIGPVISIGRAGCELTFASDTHLHGRHCELVFDNGAATLRDLGSSDGTFIRLPPGGERTLAAGDSIRIGLQILRIEQA